MSAADELTSYQHWIIINHRILLDKNFPAARIAELLIATRVFNRNHDEYQRIPAQRTQQKQIRALLDGLYNKDADALQLFKVGLSEVCPGVLQYCVEPDWVQDDMDKAVRLS